jgi:hypothetical protein
LASNANDQVQFETFRAADRFRPGVLGWESAITLRSLPAPQRKIALAEIAMNSGFDGMELATTVTISDPDPEVVVAVIESLASMLTGASQSPRRQRSFGVGGPRGGNNGGG